jgi:hypothetical protein
MPRLYPTELSIMYCESESPYRLFTPSTDMVTLCSTVYNSQFIYMQDSLQLMKLLIISAPHKIREIDLIVRSREKKEEKKKRGGDRIIQDPGHPACAVPGSLQARGRAFAPALPGIHTDGSICLPPHCCIGNPVALFPYPSGCRISACSLTIWAIPRSPRPNPCIHTWCSH